MKTSSSILLHKAAYGFFCASCLCANWLPKAAAAFQSLSHNYVLSAMWYNIALWQKAWAAAFPFPWLYPIALFKSSIASVNWEVKIVNILKWWKIPAYSCASHYLHFYLKDGMFELCCCRQKLEEEIPAQRYWTPQELQLIYQILPTLLLVFLAPWPPLHGLLQK